MKSTTKNKKSLHSRITIVVLLLLAGCQTLGPTYTPEVTSPQDKATIYVYRESSFFGGGAAYVVNANGVPLASLPSGGYFIFHAAPGEIEFSAKTEAQTSVTVDAKAGGTYYVKGTIGVGFFVGHPHLVLVPNEVGATEIANCKLVPEPIPSAADVAAGHGREGSGKEPLLVRIDPVEAGLAAAETSPSIPIEVTDQRRKSVMQRTALGVSMGGIVLQPTETELVSTIVAARTREALASRPGSAAIPKISAEIQDFSITTPGTIFYWDVTTRVEWILRVGAQQRTVTARGTQRTYTWPSAAVIKDATIQALKQASADSGRAITELLSAADHE